MLDSLSAVSKKCLHVVPGQQSLDAIEDVLRGKNFITARISGANLKNTADLFSEVARAFHFPDYFGGNWDALDECLRDLSWLRASGYVLVISDADRTWEDAPRLLLSFLDVFGDASEEWAEQTVPFHLLLVGDSVRNDLAILVSRLHIE